MRKNMNFEVSLDIIELIFSKLPFSNLPTCRQVCKAWNNVLLCGQFTSTSNHFLAHFSADSNFNCVHFDDKYPQGFGIVASLTLPPTFSLSRLKILGSCNGLLFCKPLLNIRRLGKFILNLMTNEYLELPKTRKYGRKFSGVRYYYGFGFSTKTNQYKVVRCSVCKGTTKVKIFGFGSIVTTSRSSSPQWTRVAVLPFCVDRHGTYCNGALYWPRLIRAPLIYRFDVEDEKFEEIPVPIVGRFDDYSYGLQSFNGSFYLTLFEPELGKFEYPVLKMNKDGSWIKVFFVVMPQSKVPNEDFSFIGYAFMFGDLRLIKAYEDGKVLCFQIGLDSVIYEHRTAKLFVYEPRTGKRYLDRPDHFDNSHKDVLYQIDSFNFNPLHNILAQDVQSYLF